MEEAILSYPFVGRCFVEAILSLVKECGKVPRGSNSRLVERIKPRVVTLSLRRKVLGIRLVKERSAEDYPYVGRCVEEAILSVR